jgi:hypothetical protein
VHRHAPLEDELANGRAAPADEVGSKEVVAHQNVHLGGDPPAARLAAACASHEWTTDLNADPCLGDAMLRRRTRLLDEVAVHQLEAVAFRLCEPIGQCSGARQLRLHG